MILSDALILASYVIFFASYAVFALGKFPKIAHRLRKIAATTRYSRYIFISAFQVTTF